MLSALIVDDSKTARAVLRQLLERQQFAVTGLESGEQALQHLQDQHCDLIFMDHLMPGMDGFQALKALKAQPTTADIPIVMYTSKSGEVYFGQARALGAEDILTKPVHQDELDMVLKRLRERRVLQPRTVPRETPVALEVVAATPQLAEDARPEPRADTAVAQGGSGGVGAELVFAEDRGRGSLRPLVAVLLLLAPTLWLLGLYFPAEQQRQALVQQQALLYKTVQWAASEAGRYPFGEPPLSAHRLVLLQSLLSQLVAAGYVGTLRVESHTGEFCLVERVLDDGSATWLPAPPELPLTNCDAIGQPAERALELASQQSAAFRSFLASSPLVKSSGIRVELVVMGGERPAEDYPLNDPRVRAGQWNAVAARNHRVGFVLEPVPPAPPGSLWSRLWRD